MLEKVQTVISQSDLKKCNPCYKKKKNSKRRHYKSEFYSKHPHLFRSSTNDYNIKLYSNRSHFKTNRPNTFIVPFENKIQHLFNTSKHMYITRNN